MDPRKNTARFYDAVNHPKNNVPFYLERIKSVKAKNILELGCGIRRVLVHLAKSCKKIVGIDYSQEMLESLKEISPTLILVKHSILLSHLIEFFKPSNQTNKKSN